MIVGACRGSRASKSIARGVSFRATRATSSGTSRGLVASSSARPSSTRVRASRTLRTAAASPSATRRGASRTTSDPVRTRVHSEHHGPSGLGEASAMRTKRLRSTEALSVPMNAARTGTTTRSVASIVPRCSSRGSKHVSSDRTSARIPSIVRHAEKTDRVSSSPAYAAACFLNRAAEAPNSRTKYSSETCSVMQSISVSAARSRAFRARETTMRRDAYSANSSSSRSPTSRSASAAKKGATNVSAIVRRSIPRSAYTSIGSSVSTAPASAAYVFVRRTRPRRSSPYSTRPHTRSMNTGPASSSARATASHGSIFLLRCFGASAASAAFSFLFFFLGALFFVLVFFFLCFLFLFVFFFLFLSFVFFLLFFCFLVEPSLVEPK